MSDRRPETTGYALTKDSDGAIICSPFVHKTIPMAMTRLNGLLQSQLSTQQTIIKFSPELAADVNNPDDFLQKLVTAGILTRTNGPATALRERDGTIRLTGYEMRAQPINALTAGLQDQPTQHADAKHDKGHQPDRPRM